MSSSSALIRDPRVVGGFVVLVLVLGVVAFRVFGSGDATEDDASNSSATATSSGSPSASASGDAKASPAKGSAKSKHSKAVAAARSKGAGAFRASARFGKSENAAGKDATGTLAGFLEASSTSLRRPGTAAPDVSRLSVGFARGETEALQAQYQQERYRVVGSPRVISARLRSIDLDKAKPSARLAACIDSSGIDVVDQKGRSLKSRMYSSKKPVLNLYDLVYTGSRWRVSGHTIPANSTCAR